MRLLEEATKAVGALENTLLTVRESSSIRRVVLFIFRSLCFCILVIGWNGQHQHDWRRRTLSSFMVLDWVFYCFLMIQAMIALLSLFLLVPQHIKQRGIYIRSLNLSIV